MRSIIKRVWSIYIYLDGINFKVQILVFDETIDSLCQNALQVTLARSAAGICGHHSRNRCICPKERSELCGGFKLSGKNGLEHSEK